MSTGCRSCLAMIIFILSINHAHASRELQQSIGNPVPSASSAKVHAPAVYREKWDSLALSQNSLHDEPVISAGLPAVFPTFTRELLRVQWRPGDPIDLYIIRPVGVKSPPAVLYLYSYPSETTRFQNDTFCRLATQNGMAAVGFVSALTGQRYHERPMKQWFISELPEAIGSTVHDVQMIINYLGTRGDLDMNRIGMFGQGSGGTIAILAAATDPRIKAVDVIDPWGDWPKWLASSPQIPDNERANYLTPDFLTRVAPLDPLHWLPELKGHRLRLQENVFGPPLIPEIVRQTMENSVDRSAEVIEYHDRDEYVLNVTAGGKMLGWLHSKLQPEVHPVSFEP